MNDEAIAADLISKASPWQQETMYEGFKKFFAIVSWNKGESFDDATEDNFFKMCFPNGPPND